MKHFWISILLLIVLLVGSILNNLYVTFLCEEIYDDLIQAEQYQNDGDLHAAAERIEDALSKWEDHENYLHIFYPHEDVDEILLDFHELIQLTNHQERGGEYHATSARLMNRIQLLYEMDQVTWNNIL